MDSWILQFIAAWGYPGVFAMIALETVFPPIPSEVILAFGGFMAAVTDMNVFGVVSAATCGSVLGALLLYGLGARLGQRRLEQLVLRWGRLLRLRQRDLDRAMGWFARYQGKTVFFCRMVPLVRSLISVPAGLARMPLERFLFLTTLGSALWNTVLVLAGHALGDNWQDILGIFQIYSTVVYFVLGATALGMLLFFCLRRRT